MGFSELDETLVIGLVFTASAVSPKKSSDTSSILMGWLPSTEKSDGGRRGVW